MTNQLTIKGDITVPGINVSNGKINSVTFHPAEEGTGLVFLVNKEYIHATLYNACRSSYFGFGSFILLKGLRKRAHQVEHLLSAPYALGIDNLVIELSDDFCPTTENCTEEFFQALKSARQEQSLEKEFWVYKLGSNQREGPRTEIRSNSGKKSDTVTVSPSSGFYVVSYVYYPHRVIGPQIHRFEINEENYQEDIMKARSPAFIPDRFRKRLFLSLQKRGYIGINERNYLWILSKDADQYGNPEGYGVRYKGQEFVRHKVLDVLGTLALTGAHFKDTEFSFYMTGHEFDLYALRELFRMRVFKKSAI